MHGYEGVFSCIRREDIVNVGGEIASLGYNEYI